MASRCPCGLTPSYTDRTLCDVCLERQHSARLSRILAEARAAMGGIDMSHGRLCGVRPCTCDLPARERLREALRVGTEYT